MTELVRINFLKRALCLRETEGGHSLSYYTKGEHKALPDEFSEQFNLSVTPREGGLLIKMTPLPFPLFFDKGDLYCKRGSELVKVLAMCIKGLRNFKLCITYEGVEEKDRHDLPVEWVKSMKDVVKARRVSDHYIDFECNRK